MLKKQLQHEHDIIKEQLRINYSEDTTIRERISKYLGIIKQDNYSFGKEKYETLTWEDIYFELGKLTSYGRYLSEYLYLKEERPRWEEKLRKLQDQIAIKSK